jgi:three-Cys-motif partner protein
MPTDADDFFESKDKHPWSRIKDRILASYMSPYIAKISKRPEPLLLIDAFAGPGKTNQGEPGSPLIICQAAEKYANGKYKAIFVNKKREHHDQLDSLLQAAGWRSSAIPMLGDGREFLRSVVPLLSTQSVFLYIDPFGLDCEFDTLQPFLERKKEYSTEVLINLQIPIIHRLASRNALLEGTENIDLISKRHAKLTRTLGGDYWRDAMLSEDEIDAKTREDMVVEGYKNRLSSTGYLNYTGSCPIQARRESATKYHMIFASPHPDAMLLFNDGMCKSFNEYMHEEEIQDTLFAGQHWTEWRDLTRLRDIVVTYTNRYPSKTRQQLWRIIVQDYFMLFTESEYKKAVLLAIDQGKIVCSTPIGSTIRKTKKLNDNCVLDPT